MRQKTVELKITNMEVDPSSNGDVLNVELTGFTGSFTAKVEDGSEETLLDLLQSAEPLTRPLSDVTMEIKFEALSSEIQTLIINKFLNKSAELASPFFEKLGDNIIAGFKERLTESFAIELTQIVDNLLNELPKIVTELWENQTVELSHEELQKQAFESYMTMLPSGPEETKYNDWAEVVDQCRSYAREISEVKND